MAATANDVRSQAPEFKDLTDPEITTWLTAAALEVSADAWGTLVDRAKVLLASHLLAVARPDLYQARVQSERVGAVGVAYVLPAVAGDLASSRFGQEYRRLLGTLGLGVSVA